MIVSAGECLIDLVVQESDDPGMPLYRAQPGGSPFNVAIALASLGEVAGFLCPTSTDAFGHLLRRRLAASGVGLLCDTPIDEPTGLAVVSTDAQGHPTYAFHRDGTADRQLDALSLSQALPSSLEALHFGSLTLAQERDWHHWRAVVEAARAQGAWVSFDPNVRPRLIDNMDSYGERLNTALSLSDLIKVSEEDLEILFPGRAPEEVVHAWRERHRPRLVVLTLGERGARGWTTDGREVTTTEVLPGPVVDTVGAGDTFQAGLISWLSGLGPANTSVDAPELEQGLRFATVAAGLNCQRSGCQPPSRQAISDVLVDFLAE